MHARLSRGDHNGSWIDQVEFADDRLVVLRARFEDRRVPVFCCWDLETGRVGHDSLLPIAREVCLAFSPNGRFYVLQSQGHTARVWDRNEQAYMGTMHYAPGAHSFHVSNDGRIVVAVAKGDKTVVWDVAGAQPRDARLPGCALLSPDGSKAVVEDKGWSNVHSTASADRISRFPAGPAFSSFSPDGRFLVERAGYRVKLWELKTGIKRESLLAPFELIGAAVTADGRRVVGGGIFDGVRIWDLPGEDIVGTWKTGDTWLRRPRFSSDGELLITSSDGGIVRLWHTSVGRELAALVLFGAGPEWVTISPEGYFVSSDNVREHAEWQIDGHPVDFESYARDYHDPGRVVQSLITVV